MQENRQFCALYVIYCKEIKDVKRYFINSKLLSKELSTHLTGRHMPINIFPFSFSEFSKADEKELTTDEIKDKLSAYTTYGGYPEPYLKKIDYKDYLSTLFDSVIFKDIVKKFNIRFVSSLEMVRRIIM